MIVNTTDLDGKKLEQGDIILMSIDEMGTLHRFYITGETPKFWKIKSTENAYSWKDKVAKDATRLLKC